MGLSIFAFDLAALINSLSTMVNPNEPEFTDFIEMPENSLTQTTEVLAEAAEITDSIIEDILLATTVSNAAVTLTSPDEIEKKESNKPKNSNSKPVIITPTNSSEDEYKKAIEQLIKSLQISVIHSYQSADIINEKVSLNNVANFSQNRLRPNHEQETRTPDEEQKKQDLKLRELKEELKKREFDNRIKQRNLTGKM